jgi:hypothetical protein
VVENGGFVYDADDYSDELPFYDTPLRQPQLVVPYTLDANDMRSRPPQGFNSGQQFFDYLKDSFDAATMPRRSDDVGRVALPAGRRPGRFAALENSFVCDTGKRSGWRVASICEALAEAPPPWLICSRIWIRRHGC